jgi:putative nucleotidyltransferase with HDIG domain
VRAERRLDGAQEILGAAGRDLSQDRRAEVLRELGGVLEARDAYTHGHSRRVTRHAERVAREMGLAPAQVAKVRTAAAVHDVGKLHTPRAVLTKPGKLTDAEYEVVKQHPVDGAAMVAEMGDPEITAMVLHHHERLDGGGYPDGLGASAIPVGARIIAVADTFDAMTSGRPYRAASKHKVALDVLSQEAGTQLDPVAVEAFLRYYSGKRSVAWSALFIDAPPRLASWFGGVFQSAATGAAPLGQAIAAVGAAAVIGGTAGAGAAAEADPATSGHVAQPVAEHSAPAAHPKATARAKNTPARARQLRAVTRRTPPTRAKPKRRRGASAPTGAGKRVQPHLNAPATKPPKTHSNAGNGSGGNGNGNVPQNDKPPKSKPPKSKPPKESPPKLKPPNVDPPAPKPPKPEAPKVKEPKKEK